MTQRPENPRVSESAGASFTPADSPQTLEDYMAGEFHRDLSNPDVVVGATAVDFELPVYDFSDGFRRETGTTFHLVEVARQQPVALIFGSYT